MTQTVQVLELRQKRCSLRFGVDTCTATGTPKCFQTYATCGAKDVFNLDGELRWYFTRPGDPAPLTADLPTANEWYGPTIPILSAVTTEPSRINLGAVRDTESPFGLRGTVTVNLDDFEFRNQFGDFYADERDVRGSLARLLLAWQGEAISQLEMYLYTGKAGDALADMTVRRYDVTNITPPSGGRWSVTGMDPLAKATRKKAEFPRGTDLRLSANINSSTTSITVTGLEADVSDSFGNDGFYYGRFASEIIRYTGYTGSAGVWTLSGVTRAALGTVAASHSQGDAFQRVGHYDDIRYWELVNDQLQNHTAIPAALIPFATQWTSEGETYLSTIRGTGTYVEPTPVDDVCAEAMRDGMFVVWWDERAQEIPILALRQPTETPRALNERNAIMGSAIKRTPSDRVTRVVIYYDRQDPTNALDDETSYATNRIRIDGETENDFYADGTIRSKTWYSRLIRGDFNSILVQASFLQRYRVTPEYCELRLSAKDGDLGIGDVVAITSNDVIDTLGQPVTKNWQIIEWEEIAPNETYRVLCQSFVLFERPAFIAPNDAPDFATATDAQKLNTCYITENDGTMPDGSVGYVLQ